MRAALFFAATPLRLTALFAYATNLRDTPNMLMYFLRLHRHRPLRCSRARSMASAERQLIYTYRQTYDDITGYRPHAKDFLGRHFLAIIYLTASFRCRPYRL